MSTKHRELLMELITKRFEKVLNEDALDTLQILMELYCDARALDMIEVDERPAVPAAQPKPKTAPKPPKKSKSGGQTPTRLPMRFYLQGKSRNRRMRSRRRTSGGSIS